MFTTALRNRVSKLGAQPLLTYYADGGQTRIELSAVTFANWVDKTANLIVDLGHEDGEPIDVALAGTHPGHWVSLVWIAAAWQRGCPVNPGLTGAELLVVGPSDERRAEQTVACSLHPMGRGFASPPAAAVDYVEVFAQPDAHDSSLGEGPDVFDGLPLGAPNRRDTRLLLTDPQAGLSTVLEAMVNPVAGAGSTVVAVGLTAEQLAPLAAAEHALLA